MRIARRLLVTGLILGLLFVGANVVVERIAAKRLAAEAQKSFGTKTPPAVSLDVFPILVEILQGRIGGVTIDGRDLVVADLKIAHARIVLRDIHARLGDLTASKPVTVESGLATAEVTSASVSEYVRSRGYKVSVEVRPGGIIARGSVSNGGATVPGTAEGVPRLTGRLLVFTPDKVSAGGRQLTGAALAAARKALSFQVDVPELPGGIRIDGIEYRAGVARLRATFKRTTLDLSRASG